MIDSNDPRLTAYALGELDASEAAAVETALADDAAARTAVTAIREAATLLRQALLSETAPLLTDAQRQAIRTTAAKGPQAIRFSPLRLLSWTGAAAAACLVTGLLVMPALRQRTGTTPVALQRDPPPLAEAATKPAEATADSAAEDLAQGPGAAVTPPASATAAQRLKATAAAEEADRETAAAAGMGVPAAAAPRTPQTRALALPAGPGIDQGTGLLGAPLGLGGGPPAAADIPGAETAPALRAAGGAPGARRTRPPRAEPDLAAAFIRTADAPVTILPLAAGDPASYEAVRRHLSQGRLPPPSEVCVAALVDHFASTREALSESSSLALRAEVAVCPWQPAHRLVRIAVTDGELTAAGAQAARTTESRLDKAMAAREATPAMAAARTLRLEVILSPERVAAYRHLGPEGAGARHDAVAIPGMRPGQPLTAFYQVVPTARETSLAKMAQTPAATAAARAGPGARDAVAAAPPLMTVRLRRGSPGQADQQTLEVPVPDQPLPWDKTSPDMQFEGAVALFGLLLSRSPHVGEATLDTVLELAGDEEAMPTDPLRAEFIALVRRAQALSAPAAEQHGP